MENNRGQSIFLSVVGIATLLVAIVGATFAYFSISVTGNENASSITVTTAKLGDVTYADGTDVIQVTDIYPGWTDSKQFTIATASTTDASAQIQYQIILRSTNVALSSTAAATSAFIYDFSGSASGSGTVATAVTDQNMPTATGDIVLGTGTLVGADTHTYTFALELVEKSVAQNDLQGLTYAGIIQVVTADGQGMRTWDNEHNTWKAYTGA